MKMIDHIIYAVPDRDAGIDQIEDLLGVRAAIGGRHIGLGTHNALLALGPHTYLEIIAPDPEQEEFRRPRIFGIDVLTEPRLATWVARADDIGGTAALKLDQGKQLGEVLSGSRQTPSGDSLTWRFTDPFTVIGGGIVPFLIDWGKSLHPSKTAPPGASLVSLRAEHPDAEHVRTVLAQLDLDLEVAPGPEPCLIAMIDSPNGWVELS